MSLFNLGSRSQALAILLSRLVARANAQDAKVCTTEPDKYIGNSQDRFNMAKWMGRGICIRAFAVHDVCYQTLEDTLGELNNLRAAEYNGAAGVLALLPTIGALLGAPTTEIWRLLTVVPFGGGLAMALSFGGAILPIRIQDYENDFSGDKVALGSIVTFRARKPRPDDETTDEEFEKMDALVEKVGARMRQDESQRLAKGHLWLGLLGMVLLFIGAQFAMVVVEQVTITAVAENWAQLPFKETWKLFVSDIPYDAKVRGGDDIVTPFQKPANSVGQVLHQLASVKAGTVTLYGSKQKTQPRNSVLIVVSVINYGDQRIGSFFRLLSKCTSIATFIVGTALFASVQLLALPMAVLTLTLVLAAGVFGRAIIGWIVVGVSKTEPLLHVIVNSTHEAQKVIKRILELDTYGVEEPEGHETRRLQIELNGHIFVNQRRVGHRSPWLLRSLGVLAQPFDLRKLDRPPPSDIYEKEITPPNELELGLLRNRVHMDNGKQDPDRY
ncbi:MAG: hypothetical protein Q9220_002628 [cf. Caloplaca sp. 1 TL-2023]